MTSQAAPASDAPAQAWAHREGLVHMQPLGAAAASWTPEAVVARLQIAETFYRFAIGHDEARIDVLESCFAAHQGRAAVGAALRNVIGQQADQRRHLISNIVLERLDGTQARALAYGLVSTAGPGDGLRLGASVIYVADLVRESDGCWRFSRFFIGMDAYAGDKPVPAGA